VDFGVSEIFTKGDDRLKSSSGSPAFLSPELSHPGINNVSGKAWESLYMPLYTDTCLSTITMSSNYTKISDIKSILFYDHADESVFIPEDEDPNLVDLFHRILDKEPETRIKMPELRVCLLLFCSNLDTSLGDGKWTKSITLNRGEHCSNGCSTY
jgi:serine/threonine protein kinase